MAHKVPHNLLDLAWNIKTNDEGKYNSDYTSRYSFYVLDKILSQNI
jgi:hypothetical protein